MKTLAHSLERAVRRASNVARDAGQKTSAQSKLVRDIDALVQRTLLFHERLDTPAPASLVSDLTSLDLEARRVDRALRAARSATRLRSAWKQVLETLSRMTKILRGERVEISTEDRGRGHDRRETNDDAHHRQGAGDVYHPPLPVILDQVSRERARKAAHELDEQLARAAELADRLAPTEELQPLVTELHHLHAEAARFHAVTESDAPDAKLMGLLIRHLTEDGRSLDRRLVAVDARDSLGPAWTRVLASLDQLEGLL